MNPTEIYDALSEIAAKPFDGRFSRAQANRLQADEVGPAATRPARQRARIRSRRYLCHLQLIPPEERVIEDRCRDHGQDGGEG